MIWTADEDVAGGMLVAKKKKGKKRCKSMDDLDGGRGMWREGWLIWTAECCMAGRVG